MKVKPNPDRLAPDGTPLRVRNPDTKVFIEGATDRGRGTDWDRLIARGDLVPATAKKD